ncbi:VWA domain-containing protein [uncultured Marinobacter sp.]|uniref:VWA domain-containing protein n=1 Tax=uncultured Marinobacter sp. TaxID=187379 RepID=UPI00262E4F76|nr:VWA domain-containing protein [uncultured Marinobacter sp.]
MGDFHFLRPLWLFLLLAIPIMPLLYRKARHNDSGWARIIPEPLLRPVISRFGQSGTQPRSPLLPATMAVLLLSIALAGPAWRQAPTPLQQQNDSLVIILDLSLSMLATDVEPDRLTLAKRKIRDILRQREGSLTGLVVYAADAHSVSPLTDDRNTITGMLEVLDPVIMPATGNRADLGVGQGLELLKQGAPGKGRLLLITDDVSDRYQDAITRQLQDSRYALNTLVVGTPEGGPIPLPKQGFIRDNGKIVMAKASPSALQQLAQSNGGRSQHLTIDDTDINNLGLLAEDAEDWQESERDLTVERWQDDGYWLLWLALPLVLIGWRRGALALALLTLLPLTPRPAMALEWSELWLREDQRAPEMIARDAETASRKLQHPQWRGSAQYRAGDYDAAVDSFATSDSPRAHYNRGNALARAGKLKKAIEAYDQALAAQPDMEDAQFNRDIVQQLLEQQQQNDSGEGNDSDQQNSEQQDQQQQQESNGGSGEQSEDNPQSKPSGDQQDNQERQQGDQSGDQDQKPSTQQDQQQQGRNQTDGSDENAEQNREAPADISEQPLTQGQEQWLRRIPDDPGGLLRRKFLQQYQQRDTQPDEGDTPW